MNTFDFRLAARRRASSGHSVVISHSHKSPSRQRHAARSVGADGGRGTAWGRRSVRRSRTDLRGIYALPFVRVRSVVSLPSPTACVRRELHDYGFRYLITSVTLFGAGSVCSSFPPFKSPPTESAHRVSRPAPWSFGSNGASACLRIATVAWRPRPAVCLGVRLVSACPPLPSDPTPTRPSMY